MEDHASKEKIIVSKTDDDKNKVLRERPWSKKQVLIGEMLLKLRTLIYGQEQGDHIYRQFLSTHKHVMRNIHYEEPNMILTVINEDPELNQGQPMNRSTSAITYNTCGLK